MTRLLILDNTPRQLEVIRDLALGVGFAPDDIVIAETSEDAERRLRAVAEQREAPFQIAVVDIHLGDGLEDAGVQFIPTLLNSQHGCKVIALTMGCPDSDGVRAIAHGAADFISARWGLPWYELLERKLSIFKALVEGTKFPLSV